MIEKLGHSKRISTMRKEWIEESKMRRNPEIDTTDISISTSYAGGFENGEQNKPTAAYETPHNATLSNNAQHNEDTLFVGGDGNVPEHSEPQDDELDELMAETGAITHAATGHNTAQEPGRGPNGNDFDDAYAEEMEMMRDLEDW